MACLCLVTSARLMYSKRFADFGSLLINSRYLKIYTRDFSGLTGFDIILFTNTMFSLVIFTFLVGRTFLGFGQFSLLTFIKLLLGFVVFFICKIAIENFIAKVFDIETVMKDYNFQKISYWHALGVTLIPINAILTFNTIKNPWIFYIIALIVVTVLFFGFLTSLKSYQSYIKRYLFYFILYICALEISPYIILYKIITR